MPFLKNVLKTFISPAVKVINEGKSDTTNTVKGKLDWAHVVGAVARYVFILAIIILLSKTAPELLLKILNKVNLLEILG